jgi:hypothetical protein
MVLAFAKDSTITRFFPAPLGAGEFFETVFFAIIKILTKVQPQSKYILFLATEDTEDTEINKINVFFAIRQGQIQVRQADVKDKKAGLQGL